LKKVSMNSADGGGEIQLWGGAVVVGIFFGNAIGFTLHFLCELASGRRCRRADDSWSNGAVRNRHHPAHISFITTTCL